MWEDHISTVEDNISTVEGNISTVEGIQYSEGRILIFECPAINNDEKISIFLYYEMKFRKFWQISCLLRAGLVYSALFRNI